MSNRLKIKDAHNPKPSAHAPKVFAASPHGHAMAAVAIVLPLPASASRLSRELRLQVDDRTGAVTPPVSCDRAA